MKKQITALLIAAATMISVTATVSAHTKSMYINDIYVERDVVQYDSIDMLPIADIAGELGFKYRRDGNEFRITSDTINYYFYLGSATVSDNKGHTYGLDVRAMELGGKIRIPSTFLTKILGLSYDYDYVTDMLFINSKNLLSEFKDTFLYSQYKKAADKQVSYYWDTQVPDYGDLSSEDITYKCEYTDGWKEKQYTYYDTDFNLYIEYLENTGWKQFDEPYYDGSSIEYYYTKDNYAIIVGAYEDLESAYVWVDYFKG